MYLNQFDKNCYGDWKDTWKSIFSIMKDLAENQEKYDTKNRTDEPVT